MQLPGKWFIFLLGFLGGSTAYASCSDFSGEVSRLLSQQADLSEITVSEKSGISSHGLIWALVHGTVNRSFKEVLEDLIEHRSTRGSRVDHFRLKALHDPHYFLKQEAEMEVHPFPLLNISWKEIWGFRVMSGVRNDPESVSISYEKTEGTAHIEHLCGSYVIEKRPHDQTEVLIYEEVRATGRNEKEELRGLRGSLIHLGRRIEAASTD